MERYSKPLAHHELYLPCYYLLLVDKVGFEPTRFFEFLPRGSPHVSRNTQFFFRRQGAV